MLRRLPEHFGARERGVRGLLRVLRLFHSPGELFFRSVYELSRISGVHRRWLFRPSDPSRAEVLASLRIPVRDEAALLAHLRERRAPQFYFSGGRPEEFRTLLETELPGCKAELVRQAEKICAGEFELLGQRMKFSGEVDWHALVAQPGRWPLKHWSEIDIRSVEKPADIKFCWELNRHQHFFVLGRAYWATGDEKYAETFARHLLSWVQQNPPEMGVNWASNLEVSLRAISWLWALHFFRQSPAFTPQVAWELVKGLLLAGRHLDKDIWYSARCIPRNNHLVGDAAGLFLVALFLPEFRESRRWQRRGLEYLRSESLRQVWPDGVSLEMAASYHRFTLYFLLLSALALYQNGRTVPSSMWTRAEQMIGFLHRARTPAGTLPGTGDWDDGRVVVLSTDAIDALEPTLASGATCFRRADWKAAAGKLSEEVWWLSGAEGVRIFCGLPEAPPGATAARFPDGGFFALRSSWDKNANYLLFRCGPHGGHGHFDQLHIDVWAGGKAVLLDAGTYTYSGEPRWRQYFRGTRAHNTVIVDGEDQSAGYGTFRWRHAARGREVAWVSGAEFDFVSGRHDGYHRLREPVTHMRSVLFLKPDCWLVLDTLEGPGEHHLELLFHFAPELRVEEGAAGAFRAVDGESARLQMQVYPHGGTQAKVLRGETEPLQGWFSAGYGQKTPAACVSLSRRGWLPQRFLTVLWAGDGPLRVEVKGELAALVPLEVTLESATQKEVVLLAVRGVPEVRRGVPGAGGA